MAAWGYGEACVWLKKTAEKELENGERTRRDKKKVPEMEGVSEKRLTGQ